jgi:hypothetical protein
MSRKVIVATALAVGLAIVFAAISAADRSRSRGGRGAGQTSRGGGIENIADTFDPRLRQIMATAELEYVGDENQPQGIDATIGDSVEQKAVNLIQASRTLSPEQAQATLRSVLDLGLDPASSERTRRILASAYQELAGYQADSPERQAYLLTQAAGYTTDETVRGELEQRARTLGVRPEIVQIIADEQAPGNSTMDFGGDDSCSGATAVGAPSVTVMSIADPAGGTQDRNFLAVVVPTGQGLALEIETTSSGCSDEVSCSDAAYDTDLSLWQMCDAGFEDMLLERDLTGDSGLGWLSKVTTDCLLPDTYYLDVSGQFGSAPKNFNVEVRVIGTCDVPVPDAFEDDDTNDDATAIGHQSSVPDHASGWRGREKKEIQDHSIFPRNENDNMLISLSRTEAMELVTQKGVSSVQEGTPDVPSGPDEDSQAFLLYKDDPHGGVCNRVPLSLANYCKKDNPAACPSGGTPAVPSRPTTDCIPLSQVVFPGEATPRFGTENPLLFNDDANPAAGNLGSRVAPRAGGATALMCVPRSQQGEGKLVNGDFVLRSRGWRPPFAGSVSTLSYDYQAKGQTQGPCDSYEVEPNNSFEDATQTPDAAVYIVSGAWEGSETFPAADADVWGPFDVEGPEEYTIEVFPQIINPFGDSEVQIWAGPSDTGDFVMVLEDPDTGKPSSRINSILPPADEVLGNTVADANYYIVVSSDITQPVPNWWYAMRVLTPRVDANDTEPNNYNWEGRTQVVDYRGNTIITGNIDAPVAAATTPVRTCDIDRYELTLNESQFMTFVTTGPLDSVLRLDQVTGVVNLNVHTHTIQNEYSAVAQNHAFGIASTSENFKGEVVVGLDPDTGDGIFGPCGASTTDCCCPLTNAAAVAGKIAMCDRGTCGFAVKATNVQRAGAAGYLLANNSTAAPPAMGGVPPAEPITLPCTSTTQAAGTSFKAYVVGASGPIRVSLDDRQMMSCDDDGNPIPGNDYASIITGCLPAGRYMLSVRGFSTSNGPYVFQMKGVTGCTPTVPPTLNAPVPGTSFCPPAASYERVCAYPFLP